MVVHQLISEITQKKLWRYDDTVPDNEQTTSIWLIYKKCMRKSELHFRLYEIAIHVYMAV